MTSEPDSTPRRRPPTIDLTAKEVETAPEASAQDSAAAELVKVGASRAGRAIPYVIGAVVGAVLVAAIVGGTWIGGSVPMREAPREAAATRPPAINPASNTDEISSRLEKIQDALKAPRADGALVNRIAAAEAQTAALGDQLSALARRVDDVAAISQTALAQAKAATSVADGAKNAAQAAAQHADLDALNQRIAALESAIKSLELGTDATNVQSRRPCHPRDRRRRGVARDSRTRGALSSGTGHREIARR